MIQRIQTLYLFILAGLCALAAALPLASLAAGQTPFELCAYGLKDAAGEIVKPTVYMAILIDAACVLPLVTIFLYNRRLLQFRLCIVEIVLLVGAQVIMLVYFFLAKRQATDWVMHLPLFLPAAGTVFSWLAARGIMRDEIMVRSLDRIR